MPGFDDGEKKGKGLFLYPLISLIFPFTLLLTYIFHQTAAGSIYTERARESIP